MNNKSAETWFRKSVRDGQNSHILDLLDFAAMADEDAIEICRNIEELELFEMHGILKCSEESYDLHYRTYAMGDEDKKGIRRPFSPLTGEQVLNFCRYIEVHPADMISTATSPTASIPPHIYQALILLKDKGMHQGDRERAQEVLRLERTRYRNFVDANPKAADYFAMVAEFDAGRGQAGDFKKAAVKTLKGNQDQLLRPLLLKIFHDKSWGRGSLNLYDHFDDYQLYQQAALDEKGQALSAREAGYQENVVNLRGQLAMLYGMERAEFFFEALSFDVERLRGETKATTLEAMYEKARKENATEAVREICERAYVLYKEKIDISLRAQILRDEHSAFGEFEAWLKAAQEPECFHMLYLYVNQAVSGNFEIPAFEPLQGYGRPTP